LIVSPLIARLQSAL